MKEQLEAIRAAAKKALSDCADSKVLETLRVQYLGKKGELTGILKQMGKLSAEERPAMGQLANQVRADIETALADKQKKVLYISGEESLKQIKLRANRMGEFADSLFLLCETNLAAIQSVIEKETPDVVVIDSIQTMYNEEVSSAPGSVSQVRESTNVLMQLAKGLNISTFIVGHVTKEGTVAGPRVLEHMVDTVLYFEGDRYESYRILRGVKNR